VDVIENAMLLAGVSSLVAAKQVVQSLGKAMGYVGDNGKPLDGSNRTTAQLGTCTTRVHKWMMLFSLTVGI